MAQVKTQDKVLSIVMADDNLNDHDLTMRSLKNISPQVNFTSVYNGVQLLDYLLHRGIYSNEEGGLPDLILMDLNMRVLDGFDTLQQIKKNPALKNIPIYVLTSSNYQKDESRVRELGVSDFYTKPLLFDQTQELLKKICDQVSNLKH